MKASAVSKTTSDQTVDLEHKTQIAHSGSSKQASIGTVSHNPQSYLSPAIMEDILLSVENYLVSKLQWPLWAIRLNVSLMTLVTIAWLLQQVFTFNDNNSSQSKDGSSKIKITWAFRRFQLQYLSVYLITMLADWLQGTHMYTLYQSYGVQVGTLFLTGFASSAIFGTFLGIYVDKWGRKLGCIIFCLLEIVINTLEHIPNMPVLMIGRVLGGLSTSLLFSAFESWMVSEHRRNNFPDALLASTFAFAAAGNGIMAISAGFLSQLAADRLGDIGPFQLAIALTVITLAIVFFWHENYGSTEDDTDESKSNDVTPEVEAPKSFVESLFLTLNNPHILLVGLCQAFFEGAVYTFVFLWVPTLQALSPGPLHPGLIFSAFMLSMTLGGMLSPMLLSFFQQNSAALCTVVFATAALSMAMPLWLISYDFWSLLYAFLLLEMMVGVFNSCGGMLRSQYYPEHLQSSVMSVFRVPLNILVVVGTTMADAANDMESRKNVFFCIVVVLSLATLMQACLCLLPPSRLVSHHHRNKEIVRDSNKKSTKQD